MQLKDNFSRDFICKGPIDNMSFDDTLENHKAIKSINY